MTEKNQTKSGPSCFLKALITPLTLSKGKIKKQTNKKTSKRTPHIYMDMILYENKHKSPI
jgi:hypothetical protein